MELLERDVVRLADAVRTSNTAVRLTKVEPELAPVQEAAVAKVNVVEAH